MAYTDVPTLVDGERFTQNEANLYIRDNLEAIRNPPTAVYITSGRSTNYSTNSTSFVDVDSTNMALTISATGNGAGGVGVVGIGFCGTVYGSAQIYFRILENGFPLNEDDGIVTSDYIAASGGVRPVSFLHFQGASRDTYIYKLQWKVASGTGELMANVGTSGRDCKAIFWAREMS
jgi:hypothetical protein